jgi:hypothetical protein
MLHFADYLIANLEVGFQDGIPSETPVEPAALSWFESDAEFLPNCEEKALREVARAVGVLEALG